VVNALRSPREAVADTPPDPTLRVEVAAAVAPAEVAQAAVVAAEVAQAKDSFRC
jgi:hypothetical protein